MARPRKIHRVWQTSMRYELRVRFDYAPEVHTLLYMSGPDAPDVVIEALRRYIAETNHPALDPKVQGAVTMKALGLDPALGIHFDTVLKDMPKFKKAVRPPVVTNNPMVADETPLAPSAPEETKPALQPEAPPAQVAEPALPTSEPLPPEEAPVVISSSLASRFLND